MTLDTLLLALAQATGPSRQLDRWILEAIGWRQDGRFRDEPRWITPDEQLTAFSADPTVGTEPLSPTHSLDAALSLVPAEFAWSVQWSAGCEAEAWLYPPDNFRDIDFRGNSATAPLALCIASLKARRPA